MISTIEKGYSSMSDWVCSGCGRHFSWMQTECPYCKYVVTFTTYGTAYTIGACTGCVRENNGTETCEGCIRWVSIRKDHWEQK